MYIFIKIIFSVYIKVIHTNTIKNRFMSKLLSFFISFFLYFFLSDGTQGINTPNGLRVLTVRDNLIPVITTTLQRNSRFA